MSKPPRPPRGSFLLVLACFACATATAAGRADAPAAKPQSAASATHPAAKGHKLDHSGRPQVGKASYYARKFAGRKMADGTPMDPRDNNAASKTLPLGTKAKVTNLETGQSAVVTIQDRGAAIDPLRRDRAAGEHEPLGGSSFGIGLLRQYAREVTWSRLGETNRLTLIVPR